MIRFTAEILKLKVNILWRWRQQLVSCEGGAGRREAVPSHIYFFRQRKATTPALRNDDEQRKLHLKIINVINVSTAVAFWFANSQDNEMYLFSNVEPSQIHSVSTQFPFFFAFYLQELHWIQSKLMIYLNKLHNLDMIVIRKYWQKMAADY